MQARWWRGGAGVLISGPGGYNCSMYSFVDRLMTLYVGGGGLISESLRQNPLGN